jgi:hypothetical protein
LNEERDRFLTEAMGACWHEFDPEKPLMTYSLIAYVCEKCKGFILGSNDFSMEEDFAKLWEWALEQDFLADTVARLSKGLDDGSVNKDGAADELYEVLKRRASGSSTPAS